MGLYLLYKVARCDYYYWMPLRGILAVTVSFLCRVFVKVITDYTGCVHFRHPYELGGFYWTFNLVLSQLSVFGAAYLYIEATQVAKRGSRYEKNTTEAISNFSMVSNSTFVEDKTVISSGVDPSQLWTIVGSISALWLFSLTAFIISIKSGYIHTFFTTMSGKQQLHNIFHNAKDDKEKMSVFKKHHSYYKGIEKEVKEFVAQNYYRFEEEKPDWWTATMKAQIPDNMFSAAALLEEQKKGGGKRRRSSFMEVMGLESGGRAEVVVPAS